jgi:hypothetical protein
VRRSPGLAGQEPDEFVAAPGRPGVGVGAELLKIGDQVGAHLLVALALLRVVAGHRSLRVGPWSSSPSPLDLVGAE